MSDGIIDLYERRAADYDRERSRSLVEKAWLDRFLEHLPPGGSVLDLGCGMGEPIAAYLLQRGCDVTGVDSSPSMVALCRTRFPDARWIVADMRELELDQRFDGLIAWDSFFHLDRPHQRAMFARFARHARPGAPLLFTSGPAEGEAIGRWHGEPLYHASLDQEEYRALLARHGFRVKEFRAEDEGCGGRTVWLCGAAAGVDGSRGRGTGAGAG